MFSRDWKFFFYFMYLFLPINCSRQIGLRSEAEGSFRDFDVSKREKKRPASGVSVKYVQFSFPE